VTWAAIFSFALSVVIVPALVNEFGDWCPTLALRLVRGTARRLGSTADAERYAEEWEAVLDEVPGKLGKMVKALSLMIYAPMLRRSLHRQRLRPSEQEPEPAPALPSVPSLGPVARHTALGQLHAARVGLVEATQSQSPGLRYVCAHLAALRAAAAVLSSNEELATRKHGRPRSVWVILPEVEPTLREWAAFFAASADKRAAAEAGLPRAVTAREAEELLHDAEVFVRLVEDTLGLATA
jgi:hypothetical protein